MQRSANQGRCPSPGVEIGGPVPCGVETGGPVLCGVEAGGPVLCGVETGGAVGCVLWAMLVSVSGGRPLVPFGGAACLQ